ncbi:MAG: hypothetical protein IJW21_01890 [Clostridia bacterium]|nr:hypothetical protein [Clostridia bacterium]
MEMFEAFASFIEEKVRLAIIGEKYDNLLNEDVVTPKLSSGEMYDRSVQLQREKWAAEWEESANGDKEEN